MPDKKVKVKVKEKDASQGTKKLATLTEAEIAKLQPLKPEEVEQFQNLNKWGAAKKYSGSKSLDAGVETTQKMIEEYNKENPKSTIKDPYFIARAQKDILKADNFILSRRKSGQKYKQGDVEKTYTQEDIDNEKKKLAQSKVDNVWGSVTSTRDIPNVVYETPKGQVESESKTAVADAGQVKMKNESSQSSQAQKSSTQQEFEKSGYSIKPTKTDSAFYEVVSPGGVVRQISKQEVKNMSDDDTVRHILSKFK